MKSRDGVQSSLPPNVGARSWKSGEQTWALPPPPPPRHRTVLVHLSLTFPPSWASLPASPQLLLRFLEDSLAKLLKRCVCPKPPVSFLSPVKPSPHCCPTVSAPVKAACGLPVADSDQCSSPTVLDATSWRPPPLGVWTPHCCSPLTSGADAPGLL